MWRLWPTGCLATEFNLKVKVISEKIHLRVKRSSALFPKMQKTEYGYQIGGSLPRPVTGVQNLYNFLFLE